MYFIRRQNEVLAQDVGEYPVIYDVITSTTKFVQALVFTSRKDVETYLKKNWQLIHDGWRISNNLDYED